MSKTTEFDYTKMPPNVREVLEAMSARIGETRAARAFEVVVVTNFVYAAFKRTLPPQECAQHMQQVFSALEYEGPCPLGQDLRDAADVINRYLM